MKISELRVGATFPFYNKPVLYRCPNWESSQEFGKSTVLDTGHNMGREQVVIEELITQCNNNCVLFGFSNFKWIVPISELIRIGYIIEEPDYLLFN